MASYIDWYLIELDRRLSGHMGAEPLFSFVSEVEDHLRLKKDDLTNSGVEGSRAEKIAVESFGSPDSVALEALDGGISFERTARGSTISLGALILIWVMILVICSNGSSPDYPLLAAGVGAISTLAFIVGSAMSRRWQWKRILAISAVGSILMSFFLPIGFRLYSGRILSIYSLNSEIGWRNLELSNLGVVSKELQNGLAFYHQLDSVKGDLTKMTLSAPKFSDGSFLLLPSDSITTPGQVGLDSDFSGTYPGGPSPSYRHHMGGVPHYSRYGQNGPEPWSTYNLLEAKKNWLARAPNALSSAVERQGTEGAEIERMKSALISPPHFSKIFMGMAFTFGLAATCVLLALTAASLWLSKGARRRKIRRALIA